MEEARAADVCGQHTQALEQRRREECTRIAGRAYHFNARTVVRVKGKARALAVVTCERAQRHAGVVSRGRSKRSCFCFD